MTPILNRLFFRSIAFPLLAASALSCSSPKLIAQTATQFSPRGSFDGVTVTGASATPLATRAGRTTETGGTDARIANVQDDAYFEQYEIQLNAILKTRRDEEKAFVGLVVEQVRNGTLTTRLINTSFRWVQNKRPNVNNRFIYFERVLRLLATRQGVGGAVPPFDTDIYSTRPTPVQQGG